MVPKSAQTVHKVNSPDRQGEVPRISLGRPGQETAFEAPFLQQGLGLDPVDVGVKPPEDDAKKLQQNSHNINENQGVGCITVPDDVMQSIIRTRAQAA